MRVKRAHRKFAKWINEFWNSALDGSECWAPHLGRFSISARASSTLSIWSPFGPELVWRFAVGNFEIYDLRLIWRFKNIFKKYKTLHYSPNIIESITCNSDVGNEKCAYSFDMEYPMEELWAEHGRRWAALLVCMLEGLNLTAIIN